MLDKKNMFLQITLIVVFVIVLATLWYFFQSRNWHETTGEVTHISIKEIKNDTISSMSHNKSFTEYKITLEYTYSAEGKTYTGTNFYPLIPNVFSDKEYANELLNKYQENKKTKVYYDPKRPNSSCLIVSKDISIWRYSLMVLIFVFIGSILFFGIKYFNKIFD